MAAPPQAPETRTETAMVTEAPTTPDGSSTQVVEAAWQQLLTTWDDDDAHRRFVGLCQALGALSYAGGQYRLVSEQHDAREAVARRQIDAVVACAAAELFVQRTPTTPRAPILLIVTMLISGGAVLYTLRLVLGGM